MRVIADAQELIAEGEDYALFYTQSQAIETKAILEVILLITDNLQGITKAKGQGYAKIPLFYDQMPLNVELIQGGPRDVIKHENDPGYEGVKTGSIVTFKVKQLQTGAIGWLMGLIPDNTLVGGHDEVPGVSGHKFPSKGEQVNKHKHLISFK